MKKILSILLFILLLAGCSKEPSKSDVDLIAPSSSLTIEEAYAFANSFSVIMQSRGKDVSTAKGFGTSMLPALQKECVYVFEKCKLVDIKLGDFVVFQYSNRLYCHKAIGRQGEGIVTQGLNLPMIDPVLITEDRILGRAVVIIYSNGTK